MKNYCQNCNKEVFTSCKPNESNVKIEVCSECKTEIKSFCENCQIDTPNVVEFIPQQGYEKKCSICGNTKIIHDYKCQDRRPDEDNTPYETPESLKKRREELLKQKRASLPQYQDINTPRCPKCGSTAIQPAQKGFSLLTGFVGSGRTMNYCMNCGFKYDPKKYQ